MKIERQNSKTAAFPPSTWRILRTRNKLQHVHNLQQATTAGGRGRGTGARTGTGTGAALEQSSCRTQKVRLFFLFFGKFNSIICSLILPLLALFHSAFACAAAIRRLQLATGFFDAATTDVFFCFLSLLRFFWFLSSFRVNWAKTPLAICRCFVPPSRSFTTLRSKQGVLACLLLS